MARHELLTGQNGFGRARGRRRSIVPAGQWNVRGALPLRACSICCGQPLRPLLRAIRRLAVPFDDVCYLLAGRAGDAPTRRLDREKELFALLGVRQRLAVSLAKSTVA